MVCTGCGAEANASCNCGVAYVPAAVRVAEYDATNPGKSTRAAAADLGISHTAVSEARNSGVNHFTPETVIGLDGKNYPAQSPLRGTFGSGEVEWYTPAEYIEAARATLGTIDLDPASNTLAQETVKAERFYTKEDDGLAQQWSGRIWLNPPYAQPAITDFIKKLITDFRACNVSEAILLTNNYTDTSWFHEAVGAASAICFTRGRIKFYSSTGTGAAPIQGQAFFLFGGSRTEEFVQAFRPFGFVVRPV